MKIKSITIEGMNNIQKRTFEFSDKNYLTGPNGAGKSTVLKAIQLALLGYIPDCGKSNPAIFQHSNNSIGMSVKVVLDDGGTNIVVKRSFMKVKNAVTSEVVTDPEDFDIRTVLRDIELPVFNFSEFLGMSANAQKNWFLQFLPESSKSFSIYEYIQSELNNISDDVSSNIGLIDDVLQESYRIDQSDDDIISKVVGFNSYLKSIQSAKKAELKRLTGTIQSLIHYEDVASDESSLDDIKSEIENLRSRRDACIEYNLRVTSYEENLKRIELLESELLSSDELEKRRNDLVNINDLASRAENLVQDIEERIRRVRSELVEVNKVLNSGDGVCPYTSEVCDAIVERMAYYRSEKKRLVRLENEFIEERDKAIENLSRAKKTSNSVENSIRLEEAKRQQILSLKSQTTPPDPLDDVVDVEVISMMIKNAEDLKDKIQVNIQYNKLIDTVNKDRVYTEIFLELIKGWIEYTGPNGVQTELAERPFRDLASSMDHYVERMFGVKYKVNFNLSTKSNSFSFGLKVDDEYVPFNLLSSGEKCMFTLALMTALVTSSDSDLKIILIDDLMDHLDENNIKNAFEWIQSISCVQYILAGVVPCVEGYNIIHI